MLLQFIFHSYAQPCSNTLNGNYVIGINGDFPTLSSASVAYNNSCLIGPVVFLLSDSLYSNAESFPIVFERNPDANAINKLTIKPQNGKNVNIICNTGNVPLLRIKGSYIRIDGSNNGTESRNLSLINNSIVSPRLIFIQSKSNVPTVNITLKNMDLTNGNDKSVITIGDTLNASGVLPGYFSDITIQNNLIKRSLYGIFAVAKVQSTNGNGLLIDKNDFASSGSGALRFAGIYLKGVEGATIHNNIIGNFDGTDSATDKGIWLADSVRNTTVSNNKIFNLNYTGNKGNGAHGIYLATGFSNASIIIVNNMIANLSGDGSDYTSGSKIIDNPTGIMVDNFPFNQSGIRLYHNSIYLGGVAGFTNTLNKNKAMSSCIRLKGGSVAELRNNILVNKLGRKDSIGFGSVCIMTTSGNSQITGLDNNLYWVMPTGTGVKHLGYHYNASNGYTTLTSWKAYTNKDQSSLSAFPEFVSGSDLHLNRSLNAAINNKGAALIGWENDIDGTQRNKINPDIGCDEFMPNNLCNWIGKYSDVWNLDSNWEAGVISNDTTDLVLTGNHNFWPRITGNVSVRNLIIQCDSNLVAMVGDTLSVLLLTGNGTSISGCINASKSTVRFGGNSPQFLNQNVFWKNKVLNVIVSNPTDSGLILNGPLDVYRSLKFEGAGKNIHTNDFLSLKSDANETAWVEDLTGRSITGKVSVERFISTGLYHAKSWQLLSVPVYGNQTINQAWQDSSVSPNQNRFPGYGTMLTGAQTNATSFGFDVATPAGGASIKQYSAQDSNFVSVASTFLPIANTKGYMVLVRGDRSVTTYNANAVQTTLRTKGNIYNQLSGIPAPPQSVPSNSFELLGNPLPSAIDFRSLDISGEVDSVFYVWDPLLPGAFNLGNYQTISSINGYMPVPGGTSNYSGISPVTNIQSGQAFFVKGGAAGGTVAFPESSKVSGSFITFRSPIGVIHDLVIRIGLSYKQDTIAKLIDGVSLLLDNELSETDESARARKIMSNSRGIAIQSNGEKLAILNSGIPTTKKNYPLHLTSMADGNFSIHISLEKNVSDSLQVFLVDKYTGIKHNINLGSGNELIFSWGNDEISRTPDRFEITVSRHFVLLPVKKLEFDAVKKDSRCNKIIWELEGLEQTEKIMLEKSFDGAVFDSLYLIRKSNNQFETGEFQDCSALEGKVYYRLSITGFDGRKEYSEVKMVSRPSSVTDVIVLSNGNLSNELKIKILHAKSGPMDIVVTDLNGIKIFHQKFIIVNKNDDYSIEIPNKLAKSTYFLNIFTSGEIWVKKLMFSE
ncbi:MAG: hypothetical protein RL582_5 [Bacteroidota bacterium]